MFRYYKDMPSASTIYRHNHPEYALKEKEQTRAELLINITMTPNIKNF